MADISCHLGVVVRTPWTVTENCHLVLTFADAGETISEKV